MSDLIHTLFLFIVVAHLSSLLYYPPIIENESVHKAGTGERLPVTFPSLGPPTGAVTQSATLSPKAWECITGNLSLNAFTGDGDGLRMSLKD